jgi:hypothetical protein
MGTGAYGGGAYGAGAQGGINPQTGQPYPAGQTGRGNVSGNRAGFSDRLQQIVNRAASGTSEMQSSATRASCRTNDRIR